MTGLTLVAVVRSVSQPFNAGKVVEIKLEVDPLHIVEGELYLRVPQGQDWTVGDTYTVFLQREP